MADTKEALYVIPSGHNVGKTIGQLQGLIAQCEGVVDIKVERSDTEKQRDDLLKALEKIKTNSYPGLAVKESTLLNRIYKLAGKALTAAKEN